jgi:hypothetical protein
MMIVGDDLSLQSGVWFQFASKKKDHVAWPATFCIFAEGIAYVTRYPNKLWRYPDETPVIANWHGERRTDSFVTSVGELREKGRALGWSVDELSTPSSSS